MDYSVEPEPESQDDDDAENMMKMFELSEQFVAGKDGADLDIMDNPMERRFVREGTLKKNGNERRIFLFTDMLVLTKESAKKGERRYEVRRVMPLASAKLWTQRHHEKVKDRLGFEITLTDPDGTRYTADFMARDEEDRDSWLRDIKTQLMGQLERQEMRGEDSPHGPLCVYGKHHQLLGGTLAHAALAGDAEMVRRVRDEAPGAFGSLVAEQDEFGATVLHVAAFSGAEEVLREILEAESVKLLLRRLGSERDRDGLTLACHVARQGHCDVIPMIAAASDAMEGLHVVQTTASETPVFDLDYPDASGLTPLEHAIQNQKTDAAFALLAYGANVDLKNSDGLTGLMRACAAGRISDVRRWLELGASVDEVCGAGRTVLHHAACAATLSRQCVEALLAAGAKPNLKCAGGGQTPLAIAEEAGNMGAAESLVERGARSDDAKYARQKEKWTAARVDDQEDKQLTQRKQPDAQWVNDDASAQCLLCGGDFSMFNRRHHCRSCGTLVCSTCSSHSGPLQIIATADGPELVDMAAQKAERLCDGCFNYYSSNEYEDPSIATPPLLRVSSGNGFGGGTNSSLEPLQPPAVVQTSRDLAADREQLMGGAKAQSVPAQGSAMSAVGAASEARDQVLANIEKAKELEEKTREMAENASEFASLARKIREKSERSNSFW